MIKLLKNLFGLGPQTNYKELLLQGAKIIDVRSEGEYKTGHIKGSTNIPLQQLERNLSKLKKNEVLITCCASGMRSSEALRILKSKGYDHVYNGGGWTGLSRKISE